MVSKYWWNYWKKNPYHPKNIKTKTSTPNDKINNGISRSVRNPWYRKNASALFQNKFCFFWKSFRKCKILKRYSGFKILLFFNTFLNKWLETCNSFFSQSVSNSWIWKWLFFFKFSLIFTKKNLRSFTIKRKWFLDLKNIWQSYFSAKFAYFFTYFPSVSLNALQK